MKSQIDAIIAYIFLKKLITPVIQTKAYEKGLIDVTGKVLKIPDKKDEQYLTVLDKLVFKLRRSLGTKLNQFNSFLYLYATDDNMYNQITLKGNIENRTEISRIKKDLSKLQEEHNINNYDMLKILLEDVK